MDGVTAIANILRMEGVEFIGCVPYQPLLEAAAIAGIRPIIFRQEGHRRPHGGRVLTSDQRQEDRRLHDAERAGGGKRLRRCGPGLLRVGAHPVAAGRDGPGQAGRPPQLLPHPQLRDHHQVVRRVQHGGAHPVDAPPGLHQAPQRSPGTGAAGDSRRCGHRRVARGAVRLRAAAAGAATGRPAGREPGRCCTAGRRAPR